MTNIDSTRCEDKVPVNGKPLIDLSYLDEMMNGNKTLIREILDLFLQQVPEELTKINSAIAQTNYAMIKTLAHSMRSSFSVLDVASLTPILQEMEDLSSKSTDLPRIQLLNSSLQILTLRAIEEVTTGRRQYD